MKKTLHIVKEVISWVVLVAVLIAFVFSVYTNITNKKVGEGAFLLGYRPVLVLTGSMEPYMMTNGLALTKQVTDINELEAGDVITYHIESESGKTLRITHRITAIEGEYIYTKGDNNFVEDGIPLTMENVEAKVVGVTNVTAWIVAKWQSSTAGKVMLISIVVTAVLLYLCIRMFIKHLFEKRNAAKSVVADVPCEVVDQGEAPGTVDVKMEMKDTVPDTEPQAEDVRSEG